MAQNIDGFLWCFHVGAAASVTPVGRLRLCVSATLQMWKIVSWLPFFSLPDVKRIQWDWWDLGSPRVCPSLEVTGQSLTATPFMVRFRLIGPQCRREFGGVGSLQPAVNSRCWINTLTKWECGQGTVMVPDWMHWSSLQRRRRGREAWKAPPRRRIKQGAANGFITPGNVIPAISLLVNQAGRYF